MDLVSEDSAITDTLYVLDRALAEDRIDLKTFLKQVRKLASKQFFVRATAKQIVDRQKEKQVHDNANSSFLSYQ